MDYITDPRAIETKSMEIIDGLIGPLPVSAEERKVIKRVVHTTGDPDFAKLVRWSHGAVPIGIAALARGASVFTDVNMVRVGVNSRLLTIKGGNVVCAISEPRVVAEAERTGKTRAMTAFDLLAPEMNGAVIAIGNAPTALFHLLSLVEAGRCRPALVVGTPVGFVGAAESKEALTQADVPYITVTGNKGGSNIAAAIVNAMLLQMP
ncbi:precorrin-8x methylmutase cbic/cobh putative [Heliomicrobium modesticaldum Ice1]|uniref:Precorrin-8x methylmutase cbic/cobh putative n=1 Tax=Heliobacterium modesticaldum (strain ATCC 51547 / Ice1) TaxID=498761 RepID=B0TIK3_HELMI|nr:precorrin-8X methylmutase [Heliomicrobium modesticaldum]ABZ84944.1 precorrin-8x methylmutase cbic/cobh putative [Heliomicrobium modesticaldum Ice1]